MRWRLPRSQRNLCRMILRYQPGGSLSRLLARVADVMQRCSAVQLDASFKPIQRITSRCREWWMVEDAEGGRGHYHRR